MRRLVKNITSKEKRDSSSHLKANSDGMNPAELRALAAQLNHEIQSTSAKLAQIETQIASKVCGRVRGRSLALQQRQNPPILRQPESGCDLGADLQLFFDGTESDLVVRQLELSGTPDDAPFPLGIEVYQFDGSFLSIVQNLPDDVAQGTTETDVVELSFVINAESECDIFLRLNIRHGPNESQLTRGCRTAARRQVQSFDLAEAGLSHRTVERIWIDLILSDPVMNRFSVDDLIARRRRRAQV